MEVKNDLTKKFDKGTIWIHWLTAILILALFPMGKYMSGLEPVDKMSFVKIHAILGIIVFVLTLFRTWFFFKKPRPEDLKTGTKFNDKLAVWIHNIFYFLLFGIAISGLATMILGGYGDALKSGNVEVIKDAAEIGSLKPHGALAMIMMVLLLLHVFGAIKHYFLTKENTLKRIF